MTAIARATLPLVLIVILAGHATAQDTGPIVSEGVVAAPVDAVWAAWTTSDGLRSWLAPHAEIDLRIGGLMRANYSAQGALGDPQTIENAILSFEPRKMLSIRVATFPKDFPFPNAIADMWTVLHFDPVDQGHTRLRVVGLGFRAGEESQKMRAFFERGNATTVEQLQRHFSQVQR
jgi:uncharacterized protein YndB with AHSA1/START domain